MSSSYSRKGVQFVVPEHWTVSEDDLHEVIRALTLDTPSDGMCMVDLYKAEQAPALDSYIENQIKYFADELPLGFRIIEGPNNSLERARHQGHEVVGVTVKLVIRSRSQEQYGDVNSFYRIQLGRYIAMCSLRCSDDAYSTLRPGFEEFLESLHVQNH